MWIKAYKAKCAIIFGPPCTSFDLNFMRRPSPVLLAIAKHARQVTNATEAWPYTAFLNSLERYEIF